MAITVNKSDNVVTIQLDSKFNFDCVEGFRDAYEKFSGERYIIDFRLTDYMDSSGLGMLLNMWRFLGEPNTIELHNCKPQIKKVLLISRFELRFMIS